MLKYRIAFLKTKFSEYRVTIIIGLIAWIIVLLNLPLGTPLPIYAGY